MKTLKRLLTFLVLIPLVGVILPLVSSQQPAEAGPGSESGTIDDLNPGWDTCARQTVLHDNTGTEDLILELKHAGTVVHTITVAAGASDTLPAGDYIPTGASGDFVASLVSTIDSDVIATKTLAGLNCQDVDGDGFNADIDPDDNDSDCPGVAAGWSEIKTLNNGTGICGTTLTNYPSSIVFNTPLTECSAFAFEHPTRLRLSVWLLPIGTGSTAGNYIENTLAGNGIHQHTYGMLWAGSTLDHDGNTGVGSKSRWTPRGWDGHNVFTNDPMKVGFNPATGNLAWWDPDASNLKWREGNNPVHTWASLQAAGLEPYLGFVNARESVTKTAPTPTILTDQCLDTDNDTIYDYNENAGCEDDVDCDDDGVNDNFEQDPTCIEDADCDDDGLGDAEDPNDLDDDIDDDTILDGNEPDGCIDDADCDDDGVPDGDEQESVCITDSDCDDDGLNDLEDGDDLNPDRDGDTVPDGGEEDSSCVLVADCDDDGTFDGDDPNDLDPNIPEVPPEDTDGDGVPDENEQDESCINDSDCDDDGLNDLPDEDDLDPDQDDDGVPDGDEQEPVCINDPDCDDDGTGDEEDEDDTDETIPSPEEPFLTDECPEGTSTHTNDECQSDDPGVDCDEASGGFYDEDTGQCACPSDGTTWVEDGGCVVVDPPFEECEEGLVADEDGNCVEIPPVVPPDCLSDGAGDCVGEDREDEDSNNGFIRFLDWFFTGIGGFIAYPVIGIGAVVAPWFVRWRILFLAGGGSTPFVFIGFRKGWYCPSCGKKLADEEVATCEHCMHSLLDDSPVRRFSFFNYLRLVWHYRDNKEELERIKTDKDHVYALMADISSTLKAEEE